VLILADETANPEWLAADLVSQAEHDEDARAVLISTSREVLEQTRRALADRAAKAPRRDIVEKSIARGGALIHARRAAEAIALANRFAPEHLELAVARPSLWLRQVRHAGAIFLGHLSTVALGDFVAGPNHVLPTAGTARFFSPLGAQDFVKRSSVIDVGRAGMARLGPHARALAELEGLPGHAEAVRVRMEADRGGRGRGRSGSRHKQRRGR